MEEYGNIEIKLRYRDRLKLFGPIENLKLSFYITGDKYFPRIIKKHFTKAIELPQERSTELSTIVETLSLGIKTN